MNANDLMVDSTLSADATEPGDASLLSPLLQGVVARSRGRDAPSAMHGAVVGELLALTDEGITPLVRHPGQTGSGAVRARSSVDLQGRHIGSSVVLIFENGDLDRPIVVGVLRGEAGWPSDKPAQVEVDADGQRMVVNARDQLVLRCGKASITLTKAGKVLIEGSYVLSRSTGVNRIKGGSVQLN